MESSFHSHLDSNTVIATKFCTWHDSCAIVACTKIGCDPTAGNWITARRISHRIWISDKKSLVKWPPVCLISCSGCWLWLDINEPGPRPTNDISIEFEIRPNLKCFSLKCTLPITTKFAHVVMCAKLRCDRLFIHTVVMCAKFRCDRLNMF